MKRTHPDIPETVYEYLLEKACDEAMELLNLNDENYIMDDWTERKNRSLNN